MKIINVTDCEICIEPEQEFEQITEDNIREVLEYNGFKYQDEYYYGYNKDNLVFHKAKLKTGGSGWMFFENHPASGYHIEICHPDLNKVLDFMSEFIELKPLPKKSEFDFYEQLYKHVHKNVFYDLSILMDKLYCGERPDFELTQENLDILIEAAKLLEKLK